MIWQLNQLPWHFLSLKSNGVLTGDPIEIEIEAQRNVCVVLKSGDVGELHNKFNDKVYYL